MGRRAKRQDILIPHPNLWSPTFSHRSVGGRTQRGASCPNRMLQGKHLEPWGIMANRVRSQLMASKPSPAASGADITLRHKPADTLKTPELHNLAFRKSNIKRMRGGDVDVRLLLRDRHQGAALHDLLLHNGSVGEVVLS